MEVERKRPSFNCSVLEVFVPGHSSPAAVQPGFEDWNAPYSLSLPEQLVPGAMQCSMWDVCRVLGLLTQVWASQILREKGGSGWLCWCLHCRLHSRPGVTYACVQASPLLWFSSFIYYSFMTWACFSVSTVCCAVSAKVTKAPQLPSLCTSWWPCSPWPAWWVLAQWGFYSKLHHVVWTIWRKKWVWCYPCVCWLCRVQGSFVYAYTWQEQHHTTPALPCVHTGAFGNHHIWERCIWWL